MPPDRTQRYIKRSCMSSSQLLTITESHGFRALVAAAAVWIVGLAARLRYGWRNLSCGNAQSARRDVSSSSWLRILFGSAAARTEPVLWFGIMGRRAGPPGWPACLRLRLHECSRHRSLTFAFVEQTTQRHRDRSHA